LRTKLSLLPVVTKPYHCPVVAVVTRMLQQCFALPPYFVLFRLNCYKPKRKHAISAHKRCPQCLESRSYERHCSCYRSSTFHFQYDYRVSISSFGAVLSSPCVALLLTVVGLLCTELLSLVYLCYLMCIVLLCVYCCLTYRSCRTAG
jgi:hypothetical protein